MCLSNVFKVTEEGPELFCKNIETVKNDPETGNLVFTDIVGNRYTVNGTIESINLSANVIRVLESN